jgi:hypothetical protein
MPTIYSIDTSEHRLDSVQCYPLLNSMPVDIWEDIFYHCLPPPDNWNASTNRPSYSPLEAPFLLCQICRKWREITIALPSLWCHLKVVISLGNSYPPLLLASRWLARSGSLPLTLLLYQETESRANKRTARDVLDIYSRYIPRWKNIHFELAGLDFSNALASQQFQAPLLEHLCLKSWPVTRNPEKSFLKVMPRLHTLSLSCTLGMDPSQGPDLPGICSRLCSVSIDTVASVSAALRILGCCHVITTCMLGIEGIPDDFPDTPIVQTTLRSLEIRLDMEDLLHLLDHATLPVLTDLIIHGQCGLGSWPTIEFNDFLMRSDVHLLSLTLHNTSILGSQLINLLLQPAVHSLAELVIDDDAGWISDACVTSQTFELLSLDMNTHSGLLLDLKRLRIRLYGFDNKKLVKMVESRWRCHQGRQLQNLEVHLFPACSDDDMKQLREFQEEGLELILLD